MRLPNLLTLALFVLMGANYFGCLTDLDWSWQVRTGERIVASGSLRTHDTFSYTLDGKLLHDFEWLWEVLLYGAWNWLGLGGLKFLRVVFVATPLLLLGWRLRRDGLNWHVILLALALALYVVSPAWNLRPLYCTTIGLFLCWSLLRDLCESGVRGQESGVRSQGSGVRGQEPETKGLTPGSWLLTPGLWLALPLVMLLWANMHPGVITGQALILGAIGWEWIYFALTARSASKGADEVPPAAARACASGSSVSGPLSRPALWRLTIVGGIALAATFLSPDPIDRLLYPFAPDLKHPIFRIFVEMQPLHRFLFQQPFVAPVVYLTAALVVFTIVKRWRHYRAWEFALLAGLALLGSVAVRSLMDWYIIMLAIGLPQVKAIYIEAVKRRRPSGWLYAVLRIDNALKHLLSAAAFRWQPRWLLAALAALAFLTILPGLGRDMPLRDAPEWPVAALDHIEEAGLGGNFFAPPDYGAYIGWRLKERARTYMDTRGFFFPPTLVEDSHYIPAMGPGWRERLDRVLDQYPTDYFLLEAQGSRSALWQALAPHVAEPVFCDEKAVLLTAEQVRRGVQQLDTSIVSR